jgi:hypothetical protein
MFAEAHPFCSYRKRCFQPVAVKGEMPPSEVICGYERDGADRNLNSMYHVFITTFWVGTLNIHWD